MQGSTPELLDLVPGLYWLTERPDTAQLVKKGCHLLRYSTVRRDLIEPARARDARRTSLEAAAEAILDVFDKHDRVLVVDIPLRTVGDLRDIYGYLVEPAFRRNCALVLHVEKELDDLDAADFVDPEFEYSWTLERLRYVAERFRRRHVATNLPPLTPIEEMLLEGMRSRGLTPRTQYGIGPYRADFAFPDQRLVVEADGRAWHDAARDARRDEHLHELGWDVLRLTGSDIVRTPDACADRVEEALGLLAARITYSETVDEPQPKPSWWSRLLDFLRGRRGPNRPRRPRRRDLSSPVSAEPTLASKPGNLDAQQRGAVAGHDGVVQVIAPAGSGKTHVMASRVAELLARGVPANRILCTTFNVDAVKELASRQSQAGIEGVTTKGFHAVGYMILKEEQRLRNDVGGLSYGHWRALAKQAMDSTGEGVWIEAPDAKDMVSDLKLGDMILPAQAARRAKDPRQRTLARLYELYEEALEDKQIYDFDDLIVVAIRLLRDEPELRKQWQQRWDFVLVDEYQDIEPAQELLIRMLAAPQDGLFVVGDEDQCIYAWRRAQVERIIELDQLYPGLERWVLAKNYRCASEIVKGSAKLISRNLRRFPKEIVAARNERGTIDVMAATSSEDAGQFVVDRVRQVGASEIAVLARTTLSLKEVALACARAEQPFSAPDKLTKVTGADRTLLAYFLLLSNPLEATDDDVSQVFRVPNRHLPQGSEEKVVQVLRRGGSFSEAVATLGGEDWRKRNLRTGGELLDDLSRIQDAEEFLRVLRTEGGLDKHYADQEQMAPHDPDAIEALDAAERRARGMTTAAFALSLAHEAQLLRRFVSEDGVELTTIHGAKGRQWKEVILFKANDDSLPHYRALGTAKGGPDEALEDERRLAYVAFTRAKDRLTIIYTAAPSRFLVEAGLMSQIEWEAALRPKRKAVSTAEDRRETVEEPGNGSRLTLEPASGSGNTGDSNYPSDDRIKEIRKTYPNAYKPWTDQEQARLGQLLREGKSIPELVEAFGRQPGAIRGRLQRLGLMAPE